MQDGEVTSPVHTQWIEYLDTVARLEYMTKVKREITERLELREGYAVLDAGCGTGDDARGMVARLGASGRVVGLDASEETLEHARRRAAEASTAVEFVHGDVHNLPFADATFSSCRAERVLQHVEDPHQAVGELARVTRPGGRVVIFDTDWETLIVDAGDVATTRAILQEKCRLMRHGWIGRQLSGLMREAGLEDITALPRSLILTDGPQAISLHGLQAAAESALRLCRITQEQCDAWFADILHKHADGRFFSSVTAFIVVGQKP
jgi:ubiquinone/menaquinone biosynthesis C-methylase UbiE